MGVEKRRGRGPAFFQPAGKPAYFSGLFSVSEQLNLELLFDIWTAIPKSDMLSLPRIKTIRFVC
jgi:hypothetical protein